MSMHKRTPDDEERAQDELLAYALDQLGGSIQLDERTREYMERKYGCPVPLLVGRTDEGYFAALFTIDTFVEGGAPWMAKVMESTEEEAKVALRVMHAQMVAHAKLHAALHIRQKDGLN